MFLSSMISLYVHCKTISGEHIPTFPFFWGNDLQIAEVLRSGWTSQEAIRVLSGASHLLSLIHKDLLPDTLTLRDPCKSGYSRLETGLWIYRFLVTIYKNANFYQLYKWTLFNL